MVAFGFLVVRTRSSRLGVATFTPFFCALVLFLLFQSVCTIYLSIPLSAQEGEIFPDRSASFRIVVQ